MFDGTGFVWRPEDTSLPIEVVSYSIARGRVGMVFNASVNEEELEKFEGLIKEFDPKAMRFHHTVILENVKLPELGTYLLQNGLIDQPCLDEMIKESPKEVQREWLDTIKKIGAALVINLMRVVKEIFSYNFTGIAIRIQYACRAR